MTKFKLAVIIMLVFLIIILVLLRVTQREKNTSGPNPIPYFSPSPINNVSSSNPPTNSPKTQGNNLLIVSTSLAGQELGPAEPIEIKFNRPVDNESLRFILTPDAEKVPTFDTTFTQLSIKPFHTWTMGTIYTLTILSVTKSQDGQLLNKDYSYTFKIVDLKE